MSVYVDDAMLPFGRMKMSHLMADSVEELHAFAAQLGLRREWFQAHPRFPHYDISLGKREQALTLGAIPKGRIELVRERMAAQGLLETRSGGSAT